MVSHARVRSGGGLSVLVTGGHGFIGRHLVERLAVVSDATHTPTRAQLTAEPGGLRGLLERLRPERVFHLAGRLNGTEEELVRDNVLSAGALFEALRATGLPSRVVFAGSAAVYGYGGTRERPVDESRAPAPRGRYAEVKWAAEEHARRFAEAGGDVVIARISNPVGPGMGEHLLCGTLARQIVAIELGAQAPVLALRDLSPLRDFIHVADVAEALVHLAGYGDRGKNYNVARGTSVSAREVVELFLAEARVRPIEVRSTVQEASRSPMQEQWLSVNRIEGTGWRPQRDLREAVVDLLEATRGADRVRTP